MEKVRERYLQCPYCTNHISGHNKHVPKTIGKYRVKIIYDNVLIFICTRCGRIIKYEIIPKMYLWSKMKKTEKESFKENMIYKYKGGQN